MVRIYCVRLVCWPVSCPAEKFPQLLRDRRREKLGALDLSQKNVSVSIFHVVKVNAPAEYDLRICTRSIQIQVYKITV